MCRCHFSLFYTHHQRSHLPRQLVLIFDMCADCHIVAATCVLPSTLLNVLVVGGTVSTFVVPMVLLIITIPPLAFAHPHAIRAAALMRLNFELMCHVKLCAPLLDGLWVLFVPRR